MVDTTAENQDGVGGRILTNYSILWTISGVNNLPGVGLLEIEDLQSFPSIGEEY